MDFASEAVIDAKEVDEFIRRLQEKLSKIKNADRELAGLISVGVFRDIVRHFEKEEGPEGEWTPWSDAYAAHMKRIGKGGNKILQDTGRLRQSLIQGTRAGVESGYLFINPAKTPSGFPYAAYHDQKREFMWLSENARENLAGQVIDWLYESTKQGML